MMRALHRAIRSMETIVRDHERSFLFAMVLVAPIFVLYLVDAAAHAWSALFHKGDRSYQRFHGVNAASGAYEQSFDSHVSWKRRTRMHAAGSFATLALAVGVAVFSNAFVGSSVFAGANSATITCSGDETTPTAITESSYDNTYDVTLEASGDGWCELDEVLTVDTLTIEDNVTLTHVDEDVDGVTVVASGITIEGDTDGMGDPGTINTDKRGCSGGTAYNVDGEGPDTSAGNACATGEGGFGESGDGAAGAGHGGMGGRGYDNNTVSSGERYGDPANPVLLGSGGGGSFGSPDDGGDGGGLVHLTVSGTLDVDGDITANGGVGSDDTCNCGSADGGGSGGSINITTDILNGNGSITANGGAGGSDTGNYGAAGGAGGGMVFISYSSGDFDLANEVTASPGGKGSQGSGTVRNTAGFGGSTLIVDSDTDDVISPSGLYMTDGLDLSRNSFIFGADAEIGCEAQAEIAITTVGDYTDAGSEWICSEVVTTIDIDVGGTLDTTDIEWEHSNLANFEIAADTWTTSGTNVWDMTQNGALMTWDVTNDFTLNNYTITGADHAGTVSNGNSITFDNAVDFSIVNSSIYMSLLATSEGFDMDSNSLIDASARGCDGGKNYTEDGFGPSTDTNTCAEDQTSYGKAGDGAGGGGHGGDGGRGHASNTTSSGAATAADASDPTLFGGGGGGAFGAGSIGGFGGGVVIIDSGNGDLDVAGPISANGGTATTAASGSRGGGGGGGSINLATTGTFTSSSTLSAIGGDGGSTESSYGSGGGGGGGRIKIAYAGESGTTVDNLDASVHTAGGSNGTESNSVVSEAGSDGTVASAQYSVPVTPSVSSPADSATGVSRGVTFTGSTFSSDGAGHTVTGWQVSDDNTFSDADCSDTNLVLCDLDDSSGLEAYTVSGDDTQNALNGYSLLGPSTTYYVRVRYTNGAGDSSWSSSNSFTTAANTTPGTPSHSAPTDAATGQSKNLTLTTGSFSDSDGDTHVNSNWHIYESDDCSGSVVWGSEDDTSNKTSVVVNDTNGSFADDHAGETTLKAHTTYSFSTTQNDGYADSNSSTCTSFTTTNNAPVLDSNISDQSLTEDTDVTGAFDLDTFFSDADWNDDDAYTCQTTDGLDAALGTLTINADRTVDFDLADNANGSDDIVFSCADGNSTATATNTVTVTVAAVNDAPTLDSNISNVTLAEDSTSETAFDLDDAFGDVDTGDACTYSVIDDWEYGDITINGDGTVDLAADGDVNGSDTIQFRCTDGSSATADSNAITVSLSSVNDAPSISGVVDVEVDEGTKLVIIAQGIDVDSNALSFTASDVNEDFSARDYSIQDLFVDNGNNSGTFTWTPGYQDAGDYGLGFNVSDGLQASSTTITVTVNPANDGPVFDGAIPNIAITGGQEAQAVLDLTEYFTDADGEDLTYTVTGNSKIDVTFDGAEASMLSPNSFSGTETMIFRATDSEGESDISNSVVVTSAAGVTLNNIGNVKGRSKGKGTIYIYDKDNAKLTQWKAFPKGGVVPRLAEINNKGYVFAVKRRSGSTIHVYNMTGGKALKKKRLSPKLHWRKVATGKLNKTNKSEEVVVVTKRGSTLYFRVFSYKPSNGRFGLLKKAKYRGVKGNKYRVAVEDKQVQLYSKKGKLKFSWAPF